LPTYACFTTVNTQENDDLYESIIFWAIYIDSQILYPGFLLQIDL